MLLTMTVNNKANDPDIVTTSSVMSLKDPISTMRMNLPCRSTVCTHNQCFDGLYFLQLQEQAPAWTCPVCNKILSYEGLCVDQYVQDILNRTSAEQVTIEPNGEWQQVVIEEENGARGKSQSRAPYDKDSDDDDDIIEIEDNNISKVKSEAAAMTPALFQHTPPLSSREPSVANSSAARAGGKRPSAVIDLTLSDDDEPPRPAKRQSTITSQTNSYHTPSSLPDGRNADFLPRPPSIPSLSGTSFPSQPGRSTFSGGPFTLAPIRPPSQENQQPQRLPWLNGLSGGFGQYRDEQRERHGFSDSPT